MGTILAFVAVLMSAILFPFGLLTTLSINLWKRKWRYSFKRLDDQFLAIATSIDASGNVVCMDLFNLLLKQKTGYSFGNRRETISSVLGKNQRDGTLTKLGVFVAYVLDKIDKNHCLKSIDESVSN
ncbi:hypothetical protein [Flavobacterium sp.]|jgi:hypothetical protein|uniref:hypothetical protein n=1 Tax=Flavobacterium sp. TaxID=239 RepID=UPI0037C06D02